MIPYQEWLDGRIISQGEAEISKLQSWIRDRGKSALEYIRQKNIQEDHFIYAVKFYNLDGELSKVKFYGMALNDVNFDEVSTIRNCVVYALHKGTSY